MKKTSTFGLRVSDLLRRRSGPMTAEMVQHPGEFGLGRVPTRLRPAATKPSVCGFCSTGCSLNIHLNRAGEAINLTANPDYPVNLGMACPKGWESLTPLGAADRATAPLLRNGKGRLEKATWPVAIAAMVAKFRSIAASSGPEALSFLSTGQIVTEEMAFLGALGKFGLGMVDVDSNTRQCMATSHVAYKQSFGFDAPPYTYADFEESDVLVFVGANPCIAHPILWQRVMNNRRKPAIVVIDPRKTETAMAATTHLAIKPKSDLVLFYGLARRLVELGAVRREFVEAHTTGFGEFARFAELFTMERTTRETGLTANEIEGLAQLIASRDRASFWWTMGVNQGHESTRTAQAIINVALLTGNVGRPGTGANSITGQCNAMGSRLFGNATSLLGGYDFASKADREHVARILRLDPGRIPARASRAYDEILDRVDSGEIRGLWIVATNTAHSWIGSRRFAELRRKLEFLVVQDMYASTETALMADLVLPAAGWGEKEGVFINSERRIGVTRKVTRAPGQALSDFSIFRLVAEAWGCGAMFEAWKTPHDVFQIMKELSRGQPCDFSGIRDYAHLDEAGGVQWPYPATPSVAGKLRTLDCGLRIASTQSAIRTQQSAMTERRLFEDGRFFTSDGRARFFFEEPRALPEPPDAEYPFFLMTGRGSSAQWHTGSRTDKSAVLRKLAPAGLIAEISYDDAARLGIRAGAKVTVRSRRGELKATAFPTPTIQTGQVFLPMHAAVVNALTLPSFDPYSRQPSYKACAVQIIQTSA